MIREPKKRNDNDRTPKVSIVIPSYNTPENYLENCLKSILSQEYSNLEVILVDDGSECLYADAIEKNSRTDERIIVYRQENRGVSAARNKGTELCEGDYVAYVDADDIITPWFLKQAVKTAEQTQADVVYGLVRLGTYEQSAGSEISSLRVLNTNDDWLKKYTTGPMRKKGNICFGRGPCARLIRTETAKRIRFPEKVPIGEDVLWNLELIKNSGRKCVTDGVWYHYQARADSALSRYDPNIEERLKPFYEIFPEYGEYVGKDLFLFRILNDYIKYMFDSYTGNVQNTGTFLSRWGIFRQAGNRGPWKELRGLSIAHPVSASNALKIILYKTGLLFPAETLVKSIRRR